MCRALEALCEKKIEEGQLLANARMVLNVMKNMHLPVNEAFALLGIYEEEQAACSEQMERINTQLQP